MRRGVSVTALRDDTFLGHGFSSKSPRRRFTLAQGQSLVSDSTRSRLPFYVGPGHITCDGNHAGVESGDQGDTSRISSETAPRPDDGQNDRTSLESSAGMLQEENARPEGKWLEYPAGSRFCVAGTGSWQLRYCCSRGTRRPSSQAPGRREASRRSNVLMPLLDTLFAPFQERAGPATKYLQARRADALVPKEAPTGGLSWCS